MTAQSARFPRRKLRVRLPMRLVVGVALSLWIATSTVTAVVPGPLLLPEGIPDFSQDASRVTIMSAGSGSWSRAATWQGGQTHTSAHVVRVLLGPNVAITDTTATAYTVAIDG